MEKYSVQEASDALKLLIQGVSDSALAQAKAMIGGTSAEVIGPDLVADLQQFEAASRASKEETVRLVIECIFEEYGRNEEE